MSPAMWWPGARHVLAGAGLMILAGCVSVSPDQMARRVNEDAPAFAQGHLTLARSEAERAARVEQVRALLADELGQREAVHVALLHSPALQSLLAKGWAEAAAAAQAGRIANPVFSFERLVAGDELEIGRALSFGLLDLLMLPARQRVAERRVEQAQLHLTANVVDQVTQVRQAWVRAVAAEQTFKYAEQVYASAEASAELARRMQAVGNLNRLGRAREQAYYADAATRLAVAGQRVTAHREALVRALGLDEVQARALKLPGRLPDLPEEALAPQAVGQMATRARLDVRLAQAELDAAARAQGLGRVASLTDIELTVRHDTRFDGTQGSRSDPRGYEFAVRLPVFDWGGQQRDVLNARTLAAINQLEATARAAGSSLRETYSTYRTAHVIARHHRDEILPLRKAISEENQLRYNGMIIGVFELLADAREQIGAVMAAIDAQQQFWLADAALQSAVIGRPAVAALSMASSAAGSASPGH